MTTIGIVGLGLVGSAVASRLIRAGYDVVGYDLDRACCENLLRIGGRSLENARAVSQHADWCMLSLPTSDVVEAVLAEMTGSLLGKTVIDTTTGDPENTTRIGQRLASEGVAYLDATIVGSSKQVERGEVTCLIGGDESSLRQSMPLLKCFATEIVYLGSWGSGARMKLVMNLVIAFR